MKYYGIDISQHKEFRISAERSGASFACVPENTFSGLPAVLLPEFSREHPFLAAELKNSRRGVGLNWPREAQIPVGGDEHWENGIGRVPLLTCLSNIKADGDAAGWNICKSTIAWKPHQQTRSFTNAELLKIALKNIHEDAKIGFVIPEEFGENSQQILQETFSENTFLIPRSIALAVKWCKEHQHQYQNLQSMPSRSTLVGYLTCVSLGLGEWEAALIEIYALKHRNAIHLIPVYDPAVRFHGLEFCGLAILAQISAHKESWWRQLCATNWVDKSLLNQPVSADIAAMISMILTNPQKAPLPYPRLSIMAGLRQKHQLRESVRKKIVDCLEKQRRNFPGFHQTLGIVVGGTFAQMKQGASRIAIASALFPAQTGQPELSIYGANAFAEGAAIAACCIEEKIPVYRTKLQPLHLYTITRNLNGDKIEDWKSLVSDKTLDAGEIYQQSQPIEGLFINEGKEHIEFILRRPADNLSLLYRSVEAKIPQKTERKEEVLVSANIRPGQGFARVNVYSKTPGVFTTQLSWKTMKDIPKPQLKLEYIPDVARIVCDESLWQKADMEIYRFIDCWEKERRVRDTNPLLQTLRVWRKDRKTDNIYQYIGPINSDGLKSNHRHYAVIQHFQKTLQDIFTASWDEKTRNQVSRLAGWLYLFIPEYFSKDTESHIRFRGGTKAVHLHIAGLTFHKELQLKLFFESFTNNYSPNSEWYRALRNIVRFRDNALSDEILSANQIAKILSRIIYNLRNYSTNYQRNTYNSSIEVLIYLLKRRRYDENFLEAGDNNTLLLRELLSEISDKHPTQKYRAIARETLSFLNKEATQENLTAILEASGADDDND